MPKHRAPYMQGWVVVPVLPSYEVARVVRHVQGLSVVLATSQVVGEMDEWRVTRSNPTAARGVRRAAHRLGSPCHRQLREANSSSRRLNGIFTRPLCENFGRRRKDSSSGSRAVPSQVQSLLAFWPSMVRVCRELQTEPRCL